MASKHWKSKTLTRAEFEKLIADAQFHLNEEASAKRGAPIYSGPNGQLIMMGFINSDRPRLMSVGGADYLDFLFNPPRVVTVVGGFHLKPEAFLKLLSASARANVEMGIDDQHSMANYPERDIEPGGETFLQLLARIGNRMIEIDPSFRWRIKTADGIMTQVDVVSAKESRPIDGSIYKQIWDRQPRSKIKNIDLDYYARYYLKSFRQPKR